MRSKVDEVVSKAEALLKKNKYDKAHDINHHKRVWKMAEDIARNIKDNTDKDVLRIACMWHDVIIKKHGTEFRNHSHITNATANYLKRYMLGLGFTHLEAKKAYLAVKHHEFNDKPLNIEGKILFDADKLDALTPERSLWFAHSKQGRNSLWNLKLLLLSKKIIRFYIKRKFHFKYSQELFEERIRRLKEYNEKQKVLASSA